MENTNQIGEDVLNNVEVQDSEIEIRLNSIDGDSILNLQDADQGGVNYGTYNYEELYNKPQIESVELIGDKSFSQLGLDKLDHADIDVIIYEIE